MKFANAFFLFLALLSGGLPLLAQPRYAAAMQTFYLTNGSSPYGTMALGRDGNIYGTTSGGGPFYAGTIFELTSNNVFMPLASFGGTNGSFPPNQMVQASNGNFYGITYVGGKYSQGTIFILTTNKTLVLLHSFDGTNGALPWGGLMQASNGNLYGTTSAGGLGFSNGFGGSGTIFTITPDGLFSLLYSFTGGVDGSTPYGTLVEGTNGELYGTCYNGGANGAGNVFEWIIDPSEMPVAQFNGANGSGPGAGLVRGHDGFFYGTTAQGGSKNAGTFFRMDYTGVLTPVHEFTEIGTDGATPYSPILRCGCDYYGTTFNGGAYGEGVIYRITMGTNPVPCCRTLYSFHNLVDGGQPEAGLTRSANGNLFGATTRSGTGYGTVFWLIEEPRLGRVNWANSALSAECLDADPGMTYQPQYSWTLAPGSWAAWGPPVTATKERFKISGAANGPEGFLRVIAVPPGPIVK